MEVWIDSENLQKDEFTEGFPVSKIQVLTDFKPHTILTQSNFYTKKSAKSCFHRFLMVREVYLVRFWMNSENLQKEADFENGEIIMKKK